MDMKDLLYQKGFTQTEFANKMDITKQCLNNWILRKKRPKPANIMKMSKLLNVSYEELVTQFIKKEN